LSRPLGFKQWAASTAELAPAPELTVGASACLPTTLPVSQVGPATPGVTPQAAIGGVLVIEPFRDAWPGSSPVRVGARE